MVQLYLWSFALSLESKTLNVFVLFLGCVGLKEQRYQRLTVRTGSCLQGKRHILYWKKLFCFLLRWYSFCFRNGI